MNRVIAALAAAAPLALAWAQGMPHSHHSPQQPKAAKPAEQAPTAKPAAPATPTKDAPPGSAYRSPFAGYRPFSEALEPKDWRKANEEVHETGGHIGLMKQATTPAKEPK